MIGKRQLVIALVEIVLLFGVACHKKQAAQKPNLPAPSEAPTLTQKLPDVIEAVPVPANPAETAKAQEPPPLPKKNHPRRKTQAKGSATSTNSQQPSAGEATTAATLRPPGNPAALAIGPDVTSAEAARDRQSTNQSLEATEKDLTRLDKRTLNSDQQAMLDQIRAYISQSRKALTEGDYERAANLAKKAQLLTEDLLKK
jgi:outer membrane biosynthesis protein TonB